MNFIYLLIGMLLLGLMFFNDDSSSQREITYGEFQQYVRNGYVNRVVGYDDNTVEAYIKQQYVQQVFKQDSGKVGKRPFVMTEAPSRGVSSNQCPKEASGSPTLNGRQSVFQLPSL